MKNQLMKVSMKDLLYLTIQNMRKRKGRILLSIFNVFLGVALVSSMMIISSSYISKSNASLFVVNLNEYQLWVSTISIVVCIITIFNSMLISVAERYKEIGVMKCLGARNVLILKLFLFEALVIGTIGGFLGFIIAMIFTLPILIIQYGGALPFIAYMQILSISLLIAIIISVIASAYPAQHASKINPTDALRYEV
ncbi:MAG: FtsX-like permease family protein [archaeon YNP-LCB-024-027]|nr:FtsX-like permease family protein [Candidatus Culexarchaeum yellowstonense]